MTLIKKDRGNGEELYDDRLNIFYSDYLKLHDSKEWGEAEQIISFLSNEINDAIQLAIDKHKIMLVLKLRRGKEK